MKRRQFAEIKNKPPLELQRLLGELRDKLWQLKADLAAGKVKNVREIRVIKKDVARLLTVLKLKT